MAAFQKHSLLFTYKIYYCCVYITLLGPFHLIQIVSYERRWEKMVKSRTPIHRDPSILGRLEFRSLDHKASFTQAYLRIYLCRWGCVCLCVKLRRKIARSFFGQKCLPHFVACTSLYFMYWWQCSKKRLKNSADEQISCWSCHNTPT